MPKFNLINHLNFIPNHFGFGGLQRKIEIVESSNWLERLLGNKNIKVVTLWKNKNLFSKIGDKNNPPVPSYPNSNEFIKIIDIIFFHTSLFYFILLFLDTCKIKLISVIIETER